MPSHVKELFFEEVATKDKGQTWLQGLLDFHNSTTHSAKDSRNNPLEIKFKYAFIFFFIKKLKETPMSVAVTLVINDLQMYLYFPDLECL